MVATGALVAASFARAQTGKTYRVGLGFVVSQEVAKPLEQAFLSGLGDHGYVSGKNLIFDVRYGGGDPARLPALVDELIALKPDVLAGFEAVASAMKGKTSTIPIVLTNSSDPVGLGLVQSLSRPGGNVTGISIVIEQLVPKSLELMREIIPALSRVGLLLDATFPGSGAAEKLTRAAAQGFGVTIQPYYVANRVELEKVLEAMGKDRLGALICGGGGVLVNFARLIVDGSLRLRIPLTGVVELPPAEMRALFAYGPNLVQAYRDSARYVDKILRGAKPADLPVEQPTRFNFVVNVKTAKTLGLTIPKSVLFRADRVIE